MEIRTGLERDRGWGIERPRERERCTGLVREWQGVIGRPREKEREIGRERGTGLEREWGEMNRLR